MSVMVSGGGPRPAAAAVAALTAVRGEACSYYVNVGLFGGPQTLNGCNELQGNPASPRPPGPNVPPSTDTSYSPHVRLPADGSGGTITATDNDGAKADYGPATIHGGKWPFNVEAAPASGPQSATASGTPGGGSVTSTATISLHASPITVPCATGSPGPCTAPGGFGPWPVEGDSLQATCTASEAGGVAGSTTFSNAILATTTDGGGEPLTQEPVPSSPPVNYTRHGVITNVGDVFTVVFNEHIRNSDGSLTVNGVHMYLFGPTAVGELVRGQVTCGVTPSAAPPPDTLAPSCGLPVVEPVSPTNPAPRTPRRELVGTFDTGGLQAISNIRVVNANVQVGDPGAFFPYLTFSPGQKGPLAVTATRIEEALPMYWSFDAVDVAGNTVGCRGALGFPDGVAFHPLTPARILDSRPLPNQVGPFATPWAPAEVRDVTVTAGGVPGGAAAVVLNVTVTGTTSGGFLTIWPAGQPRPLASSLNWAAGDTIPNAVTVKVGTAGKISVFNASGSANVIVDVVGYYDSLAGDGFTPLTPARILDSRPAPNQVGPYGTPWGAGTVRDVAVIGAGGVPVGATAAVLNVTVTGTTAGGFLTIWPKGDPQPNASSLNWSPGQTIPNAVTVKVGAAGSVSVFNALGNANVIVDVVGYFATGSGALFRPVAPARLQDSRPSGPPVGPYATPWGPDESRTVQVSVRATPSGATAALLNVTVTATTSPSFLTIWPAGQPAPLASSLNWAAGQTIPNAVTAKLGATGGIAIKNAGGSVHVLADIAGWYGG